jgi:hypothetical protein
MTASGSRNRKALDFSVQQRILRRLAQLRPNVDSAYRRRGPSFLPSLVPLLQFRKSFCRTPSEIRSLETYWLDVALEVTANPRGAGGPLITPAAGGYICDALERLRSQRDEMNGPVEKYIRREPWLAEYDPASRRYAELVYLDNAEFQRRREPYAAQVAEERRVERSKVEQVGATGLPGPEGTADAAFRYLEGHEGLSAAGFVPDRKASSPETLCFSRTVAEGWKLALHLSVPALSHRPYGKNPPEYIGHVDMPLVLQRNDVRGWPEKALNTAACQIRYEELLRDFKLAYSGFADGPDLIVGLDAHLRVLEVIDYLAPFHEAWKAELAAFD